jgi:putative transposase
VYHVLNRSAGKFKMLRTDKDFAAFENVMQEGLQRTPIRILGYCLMSTHWHFVVWPEHDGELAEFFRWVGVTHAVRYRVAHRSVGSGAVYQGRFKSFAVQSDDASLRTVCRYVERNALSANLVKRAEDWRWGSLWVRHQGSPEQRAMLSDWPSPIPKNWIERVNAPLTARERQRLAPSLERSRPFGDDKWVAHAVATLGLEHTVRREGRPKGKTDE